VAPQYRGSDGGEGHDELALRLDERAHPYELHTLAGGSHTLAERAAARDSFVIAWFRKNDR
jgi:hypothetical protein